jgi:hypothetical protein
MLMIKLVFIFYTGESGNIVSGDLGFVGLDPQLRLLSFIIVDGKENKLEVYAIFIHSDGLENGSNSKSRAFCELNRLQDVTPFLYVASIDTLFDLSKAPSRQTSSSKARGLTPFTLAKTVRILQRLEQFIFDVFIDPSKNKKVLKIKAEGRASGEQL